MYSCNTVTVSWTNESIYKFVVQWLQHTQSWETTIKGTKYALISLTGQTKAKTLVTYLYRILWEWVTNLFDPSKKTCLKRKRIKPHFFNLQNRDLMKPYIITLDFKKAEPAALPWTLMGPWAVSLLLLGNITQAADGFLFSRPDITRCQTMDPPPSCSTPAVAHVPFSGINSQLKL